MYQAEVNNTQQYSDSQGEHIVCKGKLILIGCKEEETLLGLDFDGSIKLASDYKNIHTAKSWIVPIIISETEEIITGEKAYDSKNNKIVETSEYDKWEDEKYYQMILALPEHFSDKHLQAISDGKMREGEVLLKCTHESNDYYNQKEFAHTYKVYLNLQNHITLFPAKQSLEEAAKEFRETYQQHIFGMYQQFEDAFKGGAEWAKENNF